VELDQARTAIDGWFRDRSVDDATALEAFRAVALNDRTTADELGQLRIRFVDYLMATRHLERAAAVRIASVRMDSWFAGAKEAADPDTGAASSVGRAVSRVLLYGLFVAIVGWVVLRLTRGEDFAVAPWFWLVEIVGSVAIASVIAYRAPEGIMPAVYALIPVALAGVLILAGA
jgi:hypothetical protein